VPPNGLPLADSSLLRMHFQRIGQVDGTLHLYRRAFCTLSKRAGSKGEPASSHALRNRFIAFLPTCFGHQGHRQAVYLKGNGQRPIFSRRPPATTLLGSGRESPLEPQGRLSGRHISIRNWSRIRRNSGDYQRASVNHAHGEMRRCSLFSKGHLKEWVVLSRTADGSPRT